MNKRVLNISLILLMLSTGSVFAQQGFGTNRPNQSAAVDIVSPNKGLLIPRVALQADSSAAPVTNPEKSLIVYNTTYSAANNLKQGFYFWNGTKWEPFTTATTDLNTKNVSLAVVAGELVLTDTDGNVVKVPVSDIDTDKQQITTFSIGNDNMVTLTLERGGTKTIDLTPYFNSTKLANGTNTTLSGSGTVADPYKVNVATATTTNLGVVQIGSGINVTNGIISVPAAPGETTTTITNTVSGHKIADYKNEAGATVAINETVTNLTQSATGITYAKEDGTSASAKVVSGDAGNLVKPGTDFGALLTKGDVQSNQVKYQVISGTNTTASLDGSSTPDLQKYKVDVTFPAAPDGSETKITAGTNVAVTGSGTTTAPYVVSSTDTDNQQISYVASTKMLSLERGGNAIDLSGIDTDNQQLSLTGNTLKLDRSTPDIDLSKYDTKLANGTNTTYSGTGTITDPYKVNVATATTTALGVVMPGTGLTVATDGTLNVNFPAAPNGSETKLANGTNTTYSGTGTTTDPYKVNVATATTAAVGVVKPGTGLTVATDGTLDVTVIDTNTDVQQLSLASNTLTLERGGSVNLAPYLDNTDNQQLGYAPATNILSLTNGGTVDLSALAVDTNTDNQQISYNASTKMLTLERGGNPVDLSALATDNNTITTVKANAAQPYVSVTSNPTTPGATADREYTVAVNAATAKVGTTAGTSGVVKPGNQFKVETDGHLSVKYAMPQFFYMPSIIIDTSIINAPGSADKTINLYSQYTGQFNVTATAMRSNGAPAQIPVLPSATDLYYYVTYSDTTSIQITGITDQGLMSYRVLGNTNSLSFINIVFVIK